MCWTFLASKGRDVFGPAVGQPDGRLTAGAGSVNGARSDQNNYTLDGLDDNNQNKRLRVRRSLAINARLGGRVSRGHHKFQRRLGPLLRCTSGLWSRAAVQIRFTEALMNIIAPPTSSANDWFNKHAELITDQPNVPGKFLRNTFGGSFGVPVLKDKLFFFLATEGQRTAETPRRFVKCQPRLRQGNLTSLKYVQGGKYAVQREH